MEHLADYLRQRSSEILFVDAGGGPNVSANDILSCSSQLVRVLDEMGVRAGSRIGVWLPQSADSAKYLLALMLCGRTAVPLNPRAGELSNGEVLRTAGVELGLCNVDGYGEMSGALRAAGLVPRILTVPLDAKGGTASERDLEAADPCLLLPTSGTSGEQKLVPLGERQLLAGAENVVASHGLTAGDRAYCVLGMYHINGLVMTLLAPAISGGSAVIANGGFSAKRFWDEVAVTRCSWLSIVPTVASYLVARATGGVRHRLRFARSASAPLDLSLHREFESRFDVRLFETLGMTEAAGPVLVHPGSGSDRLPAETGRPAPSIEAKVVDPDSGERVAAGDIGALWVSGPSVVDGYWSNPTATQQSFKDGWFVSGDLVRLAPTGMVSFVGRESEMINKGGEKIAPLEIDRVALSYPGVVEAAAFGIPDEHYGTTIGLAIVGEVIDTDGLRAHIRSYLGDYKAPDLVLELDELPRGPSGKIQRRRLVG